MRASGCGASLKIVRHPTSPSKIQRVPRTRQFLVRLDGAHEQDQPRHHAHQYIDNPSDQSTLTCRHLETRSTNKPQPNRLTARSATCLPPRYYWCRRQWPACGKGRRAFKGGIGRRLVCRGTDGVDDLGYELHDVIERF